jgi:hypothetical protein
MSSTRRIGALKTFSFGRSGARARQCNLGAAGAEGRSLEIGKATFEQRVSRRLGETIVLRELPR